MNDLEIEPDGALQEQLPQPAPHEQANQVEPVRRILAKKRRIRARRWHKLTAWLIVATPALWTLVWDMARRPDVLFTMPHPFKWYYRASMALSYVLWAPMLYAASRRRGVSRKIFGGLFTLLFSLTVAIQGAIFAIFRNYESVDSEAYSRSYFWPWLGSLPLGKPVVWFYLAVGIGASIGLLRLARRVLRPRRSRARIVTVLSSLTLLGLPFVKTSYHGTQAGTPDMLYFHAISASYLEQFQHWKTTIVYRPQKRFTLSVPALQARPAKPRNVVLILQESQRADVTCIEYDPKCELATRASNLATPNRMPLLEWRSLDSSTILSSATIWTGLLPSDRKEDLEKAPSIWAYAHAAGYDTAYFTSQHGMFQSTRIQYQEEPINHYAGATNIDIRADWDTGALDAKLSDYAIRHWADLKEPFFLVVHYSNQHSPYVYDKKFAPFREDPKAPPKSFGVKIAHNKNVVYLSDLGVGRFLDRVKKTPKGSHTVFVYTSDHAEGMGDHGLWGHTFSLFDSEIHVPTWVDAAPGTLTEDEERNIRARKKERETHADMGPTLLDLIGVWDDPKMAPFKAKMIGHPITRDERTTAPLPLTNCSWLWECIGRNWGYMQGPLITFGTDGMQKLHCFNLDADPGEKKDLPESACGDLPAMTRELFPSLKDAVRPYRPNR